MRYRKLLALGVFMGCGSFTGPDASFTEGGTDKPKTGSIVITVCPLDGCPADTTTAVVDSLLGSHGEV